MIQLSKKATIYALLVITGVVFTTIVPSTEIHALSKQELNSHLENQPKDKASVPSDELQKLLEDKKLQPLPPEQKSTQRNSFSLQGRTYVEPVTSSHKSPSIYGLVPSWCNEVGILIFADTANLETGEGVFAYFSTSGQIAISPADPGTGGGSYNIWGINLEYAGLSLINGKYNVYVSSPCGSSGGWGDPLYSDVHYDVLNIIPQTCDTNCLPVHRFYNIKNGAHFYTGSEHEKRQVIENTSNYAYEGISYYAKGSNPGNLISVHRFYNKKTGTHFYTSSQPEASNVNNNMSHTYKYEGVAYHAYSNTQAQLTPAHRFYKFNQGVHFYTSSQPEASNVNNNMSHTYKYEGVSFYAIGNRP